MNRTGSFIYSHFFRDILPTEVEAMEAVVTANRKLSCVHAEEMSKGWLQIEEDEYNYEQQVHRSEQYYKRLTPEEMSYKLGEQG